MSGNIPFDLQVEIINRVPVKTLLQFRSVLKEWKSIIDSPNFGEDYCLRQSQPRLLIRYTDITSIKSGSRQVYQLPKYIYVSVADDDTLHQHRFPLPKSVNNLKDSIIVGCSDGLFCLYTYDLRHRSYMAALWNPWIRKFVNVRVPNVLTWRYETVLGFGVSPQTKDPMIVKINNVINPKSDTSAPILCRVEVALDGFIYWHAFEMIKVDGRFRHHNLIMSFDLSSEGFEEVCLPDNLARLAKLHFSISKRMESVVVLEFDKTGNFYGVWMMGHGVIKSFTRLFNVMTRGSSPCCRLHGFMKNGEPIVDHGSDALFVYDPYSEHIKDLGL